jgi:hypothetical protein
MKIIVSNLIGGLGNQMFQFACGRALSLRLNKDFKITTSQFDSYLLHNGYELNNIFNISIQKISDSDLKDILGWRSFPMFRKILGRHQMHWATNKHWVNEPSLSYWKGIYDVSTPAYLHGYWQSEKYFEDFEETIRNDFTFNTQFNDLDIATLNKINMQPSASVHIRRGDYSLAKNIKIYSTLEMDYYRTAIRQIRLKIPNVKFFFFSDDPYWVEKKFNEEFGPIELVNHNFGINSANDMRLMSNCNHHIIANSSFSWWGAWLNPNPAKIVIAPKKWFLKEADNIDLIPKSWMRI